MSSKQAKPESSSTYLRRRHRRISIRKAVHIVSPESGAGLWGHTVNVSESGAFLEASEVFPVGTEIAMRLPVGADAHIRLRGRVVRTEPVSGMGIEFVDLSENAITFLRNVVSSDAVFTPSDKHSVSVWYEGQPNPIKSLAVFTNEGLNVRTKLPFLRQHSKVSFCLDGDSVKYTGVLEDVDLEVEDEDLIPKLSIKLGLPRSRRKQIEEEMSLGRPEATVEAESSDSYVSRGNNLEEVLVDFAHARGITIEPWEEENLDQNQEGYDEEDNWANKDEITKVRTNPAGKALLFEETLNDDRAHQKLARPKSQIEVEIKRDRSTRTGPLAQAIAAWEEIEEEEVTIEASKLPLDTQPHPEEKVEEDKGLQHIDLSGTKLTDKGLGYLGDLKKLKFLGLRDTQITDKGISKLKELEHLTYLDLSQTGITDKGINQLVEYYGKKGEKSQSSDEIPTLPAHSDSVPPEEENEEQILEENQVFAEVSQIAKKKNSPEQPIDPETDDELSEPDQTYEPEPDLADPSETDLDVVPGMTSRMDRLKAAFGLPSAFILGMLITLAVIWLFPGSEGEAETQLPPQSEEPAQHEPEQAPELTKVPEAEENPVLTSKQGNAPEKQSTQPALAPSTTEQRAVIVPQHIDSIRVISEGTNYVLVVPVMGSTENMNEHAIASPHGVVINLPDAEPRMALGTYMFQEGGVHRVFLLRGVRRTAVGTQIRVHFTHRQRNYQVEALDGMIRVILPR